MKLLIVESPGKIKTLRKILGPDWILEASVGHTTELAHDGFKNLGFDLKDRHIITRYIPRGTRGKQVLTKLRAAVKKADQIFLAMDPDREGEAIAWHLVEQLRLKKFVRVSYTQITASAVKAAIANPRKLDLPLIEAQRARQCLDKLVGYEVSPLLWNSSGGKSGGRVQSATLHIVCERERERLAFKPHDYWTLKATYSNGLSAIYDPRENSPENSPKNSTDLTPHQILSESEARKIEALAKSNPHTVTQIEDREDKRLPPAPFITSSLQQMASLKLKFSPQKTMQVAQSLYEGVNGKGLITYMRTDAVTLSPEFVADARAWLTLNSPSEMAPTPPTFRIKADAQGAHEAIRPTESQMTPMKASEFLSKEQSDLYRLIWERAIASQCKPSRLAKSKITIIAGPTRWIARGSRVIEEGYLKFWRNIDDDVELPPVREKEVLKLKAIATEKKSTQPPSRYSEAKLVQIMEKLGIGRPSTYASTVATLKARDYVKLEKLTLVPTDLGMKTDSVLMRALPDLVDAKFTAKMENSLDQIAEGRVNWQQFLFDWNIGYLQMALQKARAILKLSA
jgi:DNA topoisomerase-1